MTDANNVRSRRRRPAGIQVPDGQVRVLESHHAVDFQMELGTWPFHKVCWVAMGRGAVESTQISSEIQRDDFLVLRAGWPHRFVDSPAEPLTLLMFCISENYFSAARCDELGEIWRTVAADARIGRPCCAKTAFHRSGLVEDFRTALREQAGLRLGWQTAVSSAFDQVLLKLGRGALEPREEHVVSSRRTVAGVLEYINTHAGEPFRVDDLAAQCGLSTRRFTDLFKELAGESFNRYVNARRIQYACERLVETGHILYACHESGFNDLAYFYRVFRKFTGMTPGEFLQQQTRRPGQAKPRH